MNRGMLMALLALDLFVMGTSLYVLWDRFRKNMAPPPVISMPEPPRPSNAPTPAPTPATPAPTSTPLQEKKSATANARPEMTRKILFKYRDSFPKRVSIIGDFNQWSPQLMVKDESHNWTVMVSLSPGQYAYNFIVDGKVIRDPANKKTKQAGQKIPSSLLIVKPKGPR